MKEEIEQRFSELITKGQHLLSTIPIYEGHPEYWVAEERIHEYQRWLTSVANLIMHVDQPNGAFRTDCNRVLEDKDLLNGIPCRVVKKIFGLVTAAQEEWQRGLLRKVEHIVVAEAFDDFLDHASVYHKGNKKIESSVLASAVLEDTIKRIAKKYEVDTKGKSLEPIIDDLVKANIFTPVKAKRIKSFAGVRNHALHAEWDDFDIKDVGELISGLKELIEYFL